VIPAHGYDFVQWTPEARRLYESNYLKANSPDGRRGLWIKHNILAPADRNRPAVLEVWCVLFDRDDGRPSVVKQVRKMSEIAVAKTRLRIEGQEVLLSDRETRTHVVDEDGREASWELQLEAKDTAIFHMPYNWMYTAPFPKKKIITPAPRLIFNGTLSFDGREVRVDDWVGIRGHNWGSEHAWRYVYGNCNLFEGEADAVLEMFTAKIKLGPIKSPWLSMGVLRHRGVEHGFRSLRYAAQSTPVVDFPSWEATLRTGDETLHASWELDPEQTVGLRYLHPDGKVSFCYNTKFATIRARSGDLELTTDQAELEFLFEKPVAEIPLYGEATLPAP
jgi:hypothetical protein